MQHAVTALQSVPEPSQHSGASTSGAVRRGKQPMAPQSRISTAASTSTTRSASKNTRAEPRSCQRGVRLNRRSLRGRLGWQSTSWSRSSTSGCRVAGAPLLSAQPPRSLWIIMTDTWLNGSLASAAPEQASLSGSSGWQCKAFVRIIDKRHCLFKGHLQNGLNPCAGCT